MLSNMIVGAVAWPLRSLRGQLLTAFALLLAMFWLQGRHTLTTMAELAADIDRAQSELAAARDLERDMLAARVAAFRVLGTMHAGDQQKFNAAFHKVATRVEEQVARTRLAPEPILAALAAYRQAIAQHLDFQTKNAAATINGTGQENHDLAMTSLGGTVEQLLAASRQRHDDATARQRSEFFLWASIAGALAVAAALALGRWIGRPIARISATAVAMTDGNFRQRVGATFGAPLEVKALANAIDAFAETSQDIVDGMLAVAGTLEGVSANAAAAAQAARTDFEAAGMLGQTLPDRSAQLHDGADALHTGLREAAQVLHTIRAALGESSTSTGSTHDATAELQAHLQTLDENSTAIDEVVALINSIAFETNLLALNAAV